MIDWERVRILKEEVGPEDFDEVLDLFFSEVEGMIETLPENADPKSMADTLHFLKGAALNIGFDDMAQRCQNGEQMARDCSEGQMSYAEIISAYKGSKAYFIEQMPQMDSL